MTPPINETTIIVQDLCCATEEALIRKKFADIADVVSLDVNFVLHRLFVRHTTDESVLLKALRSIGLPGTIKRDGESKEAASRLRLQRISLALGGGIFLLGLLVLIVADLRWLELSLFGSAIVLSGWPVAFKAWHSLLNRTLDINVLMSVAVIGAVAIEEEAEAAAVILLYAVSLLLESISMDRTRQAIRSLMRLSPATATVLRGDTETIVPTDRLRVGDTVRVRPGERLPADSTVLNGSSMVDESTLTGESTPLYKAPGDTVFAGTFNRNGALDIRVDKPAGDSRLAQIVHLVEESESQRAKRHTFIERFALWYTPAVFLLAVGIWVVPPLVLGEAFTEWFYRGLVLLVISCPCALVISTPITFVSAIAHAARHGVLIKGGRHLETLAALRAVALDKTGTLTHARLEVTDIIRLNELTEDQILRIAASLESRSEHHLADALVRTATERGVTFDQEFVEAFEAIPGRGVKARVNGTDYAIGNHAFAEELHVCSPAVEEALAHLEQRGKTAALLAQSSRVVGIIGFADALRAESGVAVRALHDLGIRPIVLLTGDNQAVAEQTASSLGVDEVRAHLLPEHKAGIVAELREEHSVVGMIGDGVNDAPALARADVGIAMGAAGSDTAIEAADVVLMSENLTRVPYAVVLGRTSMRIITQNVVLALVVKGIFIGLGAFGLSSLWLAILADDGVTLLVILNSLRTLRVNPE